MTSPLCVATGGWCRRVFHYRPPTPMYRNSPPLCTIVLQIPSLMPLKMRKVQLIYGIYGPPIEKFAVGSVPEVEIADRWTEPEAGEPPFSRGQALPGYIPDFKANEAVWGWVREEGPGICVWEARPCYSRGSNFLSGLPSRSGEVKRRLPDGPAIKSRRAPAILPDQFRLLRKCTFHLGFTACLRRPHMDPPETGVAANSLAVGVQEIRRTGQPGSSHWRDHGMNGA